MEWNFDISQAPRGKTVTQDVRGPKGAIIQRTRFVPDRIIVASRDGETVTVSNWIPPTKHSAGRWNMLGSTDEPLAWMPFPIHPATC